MRNVKASVAYQVALEALAKAVVPAEQATRYAEETAQAAASGTQGTMPHSGLAAGYYRIGDNVGVTDARGMKNQRYFWSLWDVSGLILRIVQGTAGGYQKTHEHALLGCLINGSVTWLETGSVKYAVSGIGRENLHYLAAESETLDKLERSILPAFTLPRTDFSEARADKADKAPLNRKQRRAAARIEKEKEKEKVGTK